MKGFKYQFTLHVTLGKDKMNGNVEYAIVYLRSLIKTIINDDFLISIYILFEEIVYRLDNWINEGSGWAVHSIDGQYLNVFKYVPLLGSSYIELPNKLANAKKGLINFRNNDDKCFMWCQVRHLNLNSTNLSRIKRKDKQIASILDYDGIKFPVTVKDYDKIEDKK